MRTNENVLESEQGRFSARKTTFAWLLAVGILLTIGGIAALSSLVATTLLSVAFFGFILLLAGLVHAVASFAGRGLREVLPELFFGILTGVIGVVLITRPTGVAAALTLLLGAFFVVGGLARLVSAAVLRDIGWPWTVFSGVVASLLGVLLLAQWPSTALWAIGLFIGTNLLATGINLLAIAFEARRAFRVFERERRPAAEEHPPLH